MIDKKEVIYIVDENNKPLTPQLRSVAHTKGLWHRTTGVWVINQKKHILCQKRSLKKDIKPGFWEAFFGGHLAPNQEYIDNALQESSEELGIPITKNALVPYKIFKSDTPAHKEFQFVCALLLGKQIPQLHREKEEIDEMRWIALAEVKKILKNPQTKNWVKKPWDEEVLQWLEKLY